MSLNGDIKASYEAVMADLETQRAAIQSQLAPLQARVKELNHSITTLRSVLHPEPSAPTSSQSRPSSTRYAFTSVRWAILDTLIDSGPMTTADLAEVIKAAGVSTKAANFANNVSAVLSTTRKCSNSLMAGGS